MTDNTKRVYCLYRVSTLGQVDKDDIPMQKQCCREFAERQGWTILKEFSEKGVSGFKTSAKDRDAIQEIQQDAAEGKFDILLVYMFDRLGRRDDETPFVVEWFVRNGVEVWSTVEGQQRFDSHVDKLMNYIRYWQASGESIKTSIRTKTRLGQIVQEGRFRGGTVPYGYRIEKQGRFNKRNHEVYEIMIDEDEAAVVRLIFQKYVYEGYGAQRLSRYLYENGMLNRKGVNFANTTIVKMIKNITYVGILKSGETHSEVFPELQIIPVDLWERAQEIMKNRTQKHSDVPLNSKGKSLMVGLVYCGHCGSKLVLTTNGGGTRNGKKRIPQLRYNCHNQVRHPQDCDGMSGYSVAKVDKLMEEVVKVLFNRIKSVSRQDLLSRQFTQRMAEQQATLKQLQTTKAQKEKELASYKSEVYKAIQGQSSWNQDILNELIVETKSALESVEADLASAQKLVDDADKAVKDLGEQYDRFLTWADMFEGSTLEGKKMIMWQLIDKVHIYRDYKIEVDLKATAKEFKALWRGTKKAPSKDGVA